MISILALSRTSMRISFQHRNLFLPLPFLHCCKYSQLHMSAMYDHEHERKAHTISRLQQHQQTHNKGWGFATESPRTLWHTGGSRQRHPRYTSARQGRPGVARRNLHEDDHRQTTARHRPVSRQTCFQQQVSSHTWNHTLVARWV